MWSNSSNGFLFGPFIRLVRRFVGIPLLIELLTGLNDHLHKQHDLVAGLHSRYSAGMREFRQSADRIVVLETALGEVRQHMAVQSALLSEAVQVLEQEKAVWQSLMEAWQAFKRDHGERPWQTIEALERFMSGLENHIAELSSRVDYGLRDLLVVLDRRSSFIPASGYQLETEYPVALDTADHRFPRGTKQDNTRWPGFCFRCEQIFGRPLAVLDLGCAGGGLVLEFILRGHRAIGLEGSDYSQRSLRAEWRLLKDHLFTCDVTRPFTVLENRGSPAKFDVICAWEVLEHLPAERLPQFFANVRQHLSDDGVFAASVATFEDVEGDIAWHVTVKPRDWWLERIKDAGMKVVDDLFEVVDFPRGSGNGADDWDERTSPELGFHIVARVE